MDMPLIPKNQHQNIPSTNNQPNKTQLNFSSTEDYFHYVVSDADELKKTLAHNDKILDDYDESGNTLLHIIASAKVIKDGVGKNGAQLMQGITSSVKPYLTEQRVCAKNRDGDTVLHVHAKNMWLRGWECFQQTMEVYLNHSDSGRALSLTNNAGNTVLCILYERPKLFLLKGDQNSYTEENLSLNRRYFLLHPPSITDMLVKNCPDINFNSLCQVGEGSYGACMNTLTMAIQNHHFDEAIKLLDHGANTIWLYGGIKTESILNETIKLFRHSPSDMSKFKLIVDKINERSAFPNAQEHHRENGHEQLALLSNKSPAPQMIISPNPPLASYSYISRSI